MLPLPRRRRHPNLSKGPLAPSRARLPNQARKGENANFPISALLNQFNELIKPKIYSIFFSSFGDDIPGMEGLGTDITVVCPWEAFGDMELSDLAKYGIV